MAAARRAKVYRACMGCSAENTGPPYPRFGPTQRYIGDCSKCAVTGGIYQPHMRQRCAQGRLGALGAVYLGHGAQSGTLYPPLVECSLNL
jgi:hypothetical protein